MLQRTRWAWHARASFSPVRLSTQWSIAPRRCLASNANEHDTDIHEDFDKHECFEAADSLDDGPSRQNAGPTRRNITCMGTVSVQSPRSSKIEDLISQIQPQNIGRASLPNTLPSILLLLLTPAMVEHAFSSDLPLRVLQRFGANPTASKPLEVITAIVDRVPAPGASRAGEQGIGYHFATSPGPLPTFTQVPLQSSTQKPGFLTFDLPKMRRWFDGEPSVQLPLAQTIFSTGLPSTMIHIRYEFDPLSGLLRKSTSQRLEAQTVRVPIGSEDTRIVSEIPLLPLTPLRRVANSMGNIVRKVSDQIYREDAKAYGEVWPPVQSDTDSSQPASQELEAAVNEYFKLNNKSPAPVQVWALVVPKETFDLHAAKNSKGAYKVRTEFFSYDQTQLQDTWVPRETIGNARRVVSSKTINRELSKLLGKGARLCQVLSGGGGWGKKAGLISLDPDTTYSTRDLRGERGWVFDFESDDGEGSFNEQQRQALGDVVREGDGIMLFLATKPNDQSPLPLSGVWKSGDRSVTFGVAPSTIDEAQPVTNESDSGVAQQIHHHPNSFGMLSEGGMALTLAKDGKPVTQTKLDVPLQYLILANVAEDEESRPKKSQNSPARRQGQSTSFQQSPVDRSWNKSPDYEGSPIRKVQIDRNAMPRTLEEENAAVVFPSLRGKSRLHGHNTHRQHTSVVKDTTDGT